ncbi:MAG: hypothetical protein AAFN50_12650, partial [Pseudomonadota bacterium]
MNRLIIAIATGAIVLLANPVAAGQKASELSADLPDPRVLQVQQKVESLFVSGKFERAFFIYVNELAPIGDKYAQYMVGFLHELRRVTLGGKPVPRRGDDSVLRR